MITKINTKIKVALVVGLVFITIIILFGGAIYFFQNKFSFEDFYKRLETRASISAKYNLEPDTLNAESLKAIRNDHLDKLEKEKEYLIEVLPGKEISQVGKKYDLPEYFLNDLISVGRSRAKNGDTFFAGIKQVIDNRTYLVIVSAENYYASHHLMFLRNILIISVALVILIVVSLSVYFSRHIFDPIKQITDKVKQISTENLHLRLDKNNNNNEISELINTFNDLLSRIETALETQKNFISNASHELGTPLTSIIGEADVSLLKERSITEYQDSLKNILQQADRLDQITKSLLFLAQTGYKGKADFVETLRIDEIIWETKQIIDKLNPANKIFVDLSLLPEDPKKLKVKGNRQLLQLAFANILSNACKYSNNKPVSVYIASSHALVFLTIKDQGIGIPETELGYIYDPFFRASNTKLFEGYGIGLPLARNVINLHRGELLVTSVLNEGTTVQIKLPLIFFR